MRRHLLVCIGLLISILMTAAPVSQGDAKRKAAVFLNSKGILSASLQMTKRQAMSQQQGQTAYFVFNRDHNQGFVIVSGDDRTPAIIGYSDKGCYDESNMPDNMREWMKEYERQMEWLSQQPAAPAFVNKAPVRKAISPLISTLWNQGAPYNKMCPTDVDGYTCVTGCVATAMAQVLNYHGQHTGKPEAVCTDIPAYITEANNLSVPAIASGTTFDWANMLDEYYGSEGTNYTTVQANAVAQLMVACGTSVQMDYTSDWSGAQTANVATAMRNYFGFDTATNYKHRSTYNMANWNNMIYNELAENRPVVYSGSSSGGGHAFVIDGFDGDELFHVNWGWGGSQNGWFLLSVLTPSDNSGIGASNTSDGYNYDQGAIFNAQPDTGSGESPELAMTFSNLSANGNQLSFETFNYTGETYQFDFGVAEWNSEDNSIVKVLYNTYSSNPLPTGWGWSNFTITLYSGLSVGTHKVVPISRVRGTSTWIIPADVKSKHFVVTVDDSNNYTATTSFVTDLTASNFEFPGSKAAGELQMVNLTVENHGDEYYGKLYLFTNTTNAISSKHTTLTGITVLEGATTKASFEFKPATAGTYYLWVATDATGTKVIGQTQVNIEGTAGQVSDNVELTLVPYIKNTNTVGNAILGNKATMVLRITNNTNTTYQNVVQFSLCRYNPWKYEESMLQLVTVPANSTKEFECTFNTELNPTVTYTLAAYYLKGSSWSSVTWGNDYTVAPSVITYLADGTNTVVEASKNYTVPNDVVAVDLRGNTTTTTITPNGNPNCLYVLSEGASTPSGLTSNVVKGSVAESIILTDEGLGFYTPVDFTAQSITYTRIFDKGLEPNDDLFGNNWTTICLPFTVKEVTVGDAATTWMKNETDDSGNFWLMEYTEDDEGIMAFDHAEAFQANIPYLIAVPDGRAQGHTSMMNTPVVFKGDNVEIAANVKNIVAAEYYKAVGTLLEKPATKGMFVLDADGKALTEATTTVAPFRSYMAVTTIGNASVIPDLLFFGNVDVTLAGFAKGDVNGDGEVGIADIVAITNVMAGITTEEATKARADVNSDHEVGIADIVAVTNIMAGK